MDPETSIPGRLWAALTHHWRWLLPVVLVLGLGLWVFFWYLLPVVLAGLVMLVALALGARRWALVAGLVMIGFLVWKPALILIFSRTEEVVITREPDERRGQRLVYTDKGTYKVKDVPLLFQFSSSDMWGMFTRGRECTISSYGIRLGLLSRYPTIYRAKCQALGDIPASHDGDAATAPAGSGNGS